FDLSNRVVRAQIGTISGTSIPLPYGGALRQVQVDLNPEALRARKLTPFDVSDALVQQIPIIPAGTGKIGGTADAAKLPAAPQSVAELNDIQIRTQEDGSLIYVRDIAFAHDGHSPQTNIVRVDGRRAVLMSVLKTGSASSLAIVSEIRRRLDSLRSI